MHRTDLERFNKRCSILSHRIHIDRACSIVRAATLPAMVVGDAAIAILESRDLRSKERGIPEQTMAENNRRAATAGILVIKRGAVYADHWH